MATHQEAVWRFRMSESADVPESGGYFDAYGLTDAETELMNLVYGPTALTITEAAARLGMPHSDAALLLRSALTRIGREDRG